MADHCTFSPSAAKRWLACPGSIPFCEDIPDTPSEDALLGTRAHRVAEQAIKNRFDPLDGKSLTDLTDDADMIEHAATYANWLADTYGEDVVWHTEERVEIQLPNTDLPAMFGTCDAYAVIKTDTETKLIVVDYKYGRHPVEVEGNPQLGLYALGLAKALDLCVTLSIELVIYQPYCGGAKVWKTNGQHIDELARFAANRVSQILQIREHFRAGEDIRSALVPGPEQCRYCRGAGTCPALAQKALAVAEVKPTEPAPEALPVPTTPMQLARALPWLELIEKWCDKVRSAAHGVIESGGEVPGYKLVEGRAGPRKWADGAEEAINAMSIKKAVLYVPKLISPSEAERMAKKGEIGPRQWKNIQPLITRTPPKPCLVPESDKRPAIEFNTADEFDALEGDLF